MAKLCRREWQVTFFVSPAFFTAVATVALARQVGEEAPARPRAPVSTDLATILRLGWPLSAQHVTEVGAFTVLAVFAGWMGSAMLAAHHLTFNLITLTFMVPLGVSTAACVSPSFVATSR